MEEQRGDNSRRMVKADAPGPQTKAQATARTIGDDESFIPP